MRRKVFLVAALGFLQLLDCWLTLHAVNQGFQEANPLMAFVLDSSVWGFVGVKAAVACSSGLFLLSNRRWVWYGLKALVVVYAGLLMWHLAHVGA